MQASLVISYIFVIYSLIILEGIPLSFPTQHDCASIKKQCVLPVEIVRMYSQSVIDAVIDVVTDAVTDAVIALYVKNA